MGRKKSGTAPSSECRCPAYTRYSQATAAAAKPIDSARHRALPRRQLKVHHGGTREQVA
jgi:hypothetical protein